GWRHPQRAGRLQGAGAGGRRRAHRPPSDVRPGGCRRAGRGPHAATARRGAAGLHGPGRLRHAGGHRCRGAGAGPSLHRSTLPTMLISIDQVLSKDEVRAFRAELDAADWQDGAATAGTLARSVKRNQQLADGSELAVRLGQHILRRLAATPLFISAALPRTIYPPKFNRYADGGTYGAHVDSALMFLPGSSQQMRTDLSATLFLAEPEEY